MINLDFHAYDFKIKLVEDKKYIYDIIRKKYILLTPEEWVRQHIVWYFIHQLNYPKTLLSIEKQIKVNGTTKRYDIVVYQNDLKPWMVVECKEFDTPITENAFQQLIRYQSTLNCKYGVVTNGAQTFCCLMDIENFHWLQQLPQF